MSRALLLISTFSLGLFCAAVVSAQSGEIEEIVVTAEFRPNTLNNTPVSASVVLPNSNGTVVNHLEEVLSQAPNVNFASGGSRARFYQIRGIGERGQFAETLNPSVGLTIDGVDMSGIGTGATLFDVQQVEVLRGPQGTLYGANALAGIINVRTPNPTAELSSAWRLDAGDYGALGIGGVVSGPLNDQIGFRLSAQKYQDDGFIDNDFLDADDTDNHDELTIRAKLNGETERATWQFAFGRVDVDNGYDAFSLDNNRHTRSDEPGQDVQQTTYASFAVNWDASEQAMLQATAAVASSDLEYGYDEDWAYEGFDPIGNTSTDLYDRDRDTQSLDVRLISNPGGEILGGWDWVAGLYVLNQSVDLDRTYTFASPFSNSFDIDRRAVYGELSRPVGNDLKLTFGLRLENHSASYDDTNGVSFDPDDDLVGGRALLEKPLGSNGILYAGVTRGYKSGGFNQDGTLDPGQREFDSEALWNVEAGYKALLADDRLSLRASVFRMERDDVQLSKSDMRLIPGGGGAVEFIEFIDNASEGFNQGVELELYYAATDQLDLFLNLGLLDTEYDADETGRDLGGRDQAHAPSYQYFAGAEYLIGNGVSVRLEAEGKDDYYFSVTHDTRSDSYQLINASVRYDAENWNVRLWGRNLTDKDYYVRGFFFGNDPRDFYTARPFTQLGEPRRVGITLEANF